MAECWSLLNSRRLKPTEGSNPSPSATETSDSGYSSGLLTRDSKESREFESHRLRLRSPKRATADKVRQSRSRRRVSTFNISISANLDILNSCTTFTSSSVPIVFHIPVVLTISRNDSNDILPATFLQQKVVDQLS